MIWRTPYRKLQAWKKRYEKYLMPIFLFLGFIVDYITLNRVDTVFDNAIITAYVLLTGLVVFVSHHLTYTQEELSLRLRKIQLFLPFLLQFAYGGLLSGITIFYYHSTSLLTLPFLVLLIILFLGNDVLHQRYPKLSFQILVLGIATTAYSILLTPVIIGHTSWTVFLLGLFIGVLITYGYSELFKKYIPALYNQFALKIKIIIVAIFFLFLFMYSLNILPPVPLSLKTAGIYSSIERISADNYAFTEFEKPWYLFWRETARTINHSGKIYVFASVFAPRNFSETLYHKWSTYDETTLKWKQTDRIPMGIIGGRAEGFRGYTSKSNLSPGKWRIDITNKKGQIIDRISFRKE
jgi:hypothetical protein